MQGARRTYMSNVFKKFNEGYKSFFSRCETNAHLAFVEGKSSPSPLMD